MPTDLTGTPTSLGIGTYNTSADAPSGLGFNEAMAQIDALIAARVTSPSGIAVNEAPVWSGSAWVRGPAITTSTFAGGPPSSPKDGDIWVATAVDGNGVRWAFQYNAGSGSSFKWEFIGGGWMRNSGDPNAVINTLTQVGASGFYYQPSTMSVTIPRNGDWMLRGIASADSAASAGQVGAVVFTSATPQGNAWTVPISTGIPVVLPAEWSALNLSAPLSAGIAVGNASAPGTYKVRGTAIFVQPIRIS